MHDEELIPPGHDVETPASQKILPKYDSEDYRATAPNSNDHSECLRPSFSTIFSKGLSSEIKEDDSAGPQKTDAYPATRPHIQPFEITQPTRHRRGSSEPSLHPIFKKRDARRILSPSSTSEWASNRHFRIDSFDTTSVNPEDYTIDDAASSILHNMMSEIGRAAFGIVSAEAWICAPSVNEEKGDPEESVSGRGGGFFAASNQSGSGKSRNFFGGLTNNSGTGRSRNFFGGLKNDGNSTPAEEKGVKYGEEATVERLKQMGVPISNFNQSFRSVRSNRGSGFPLLRHKGRKNHLVCRGTWVDPVYSSSLVCH
mmetsp:Transcript_42344/g.83159  ORF Transcript_42344/g.83159 Transcript_42344/m.83159 type:complete len:313 (+) Transcript_42344:29-967(+)